MKELRITEKEAGQRFDKFLKKYLSAAPGSFIYKMLRKKNITLNGKKASGSETLSAGDGIKLFLSDETLAKFHTETASSAAAPISKKNVKLSVVYEDDDLIFINKPANMLTQKGNSNEASLTEYLLEDLIRRNALTQDELRAFRPSPANRLDRNTSGLVLCSKSLRGAQFLSELIHDRSLKKEYLVLVAGAMNDSGKKTVYFTKDSSQNRVTLFANDGPGRKQMITGITPLVSNETASKLLIELITGKTHQIRAHLAYLKHPVLGDLKYGSSAANRRVNAILPVRRQMLHAWRITFPDIEGTFSYLSGKTVTADAPADFQRTESALDLSSKD